MIYIENLKEKVSQKKQSEIGRALLQKGLKTEYDMRDMPMILSGSYGKPYFAFHSDIHFNISHCDIAVVCILSRKPVGIDVEKIKSFDEELARYVTNPKEFEDLIKSDNPALAFTILWTKKESFMKLTGSGLTSKEEIQNILSDNRVKFDSIINETGGYVITSCEYIA